MKTENPIKNVRFYNKNDVTKAVRLDKHHVSCFRIFKTTIEEAVMDIRIIQYFWVHKFSKSCAYYHKFNWQFVAILLFTYIYFL